MKLKKKLIIIRGAPAAGKSTLAKNLVKEFKKENKVSLLIPDEFKWVMTAHDKRDNKDFKIAFDNYRHILKSYLQAGYTIVTEDTWDRKPFEVSEVVEQGKKFGYKVCQFLLKGSWDSIKYQNTLRPMVLHQKQLEAQYNSIYRTTNKNEIIVEIDNKSPSQIVKEVLKHIDS